MSYAAALEILHSMTPELFVVQENKKRKFSLDELRTLLSHLQNPEQKFPAVLIAGTNGKGSTASTLASILKASGCRAGLYTSPHLERVNERIQICGAEIPDEDFGRIVLSIHSLARDLVSREVLPHMPSFFELLTATAFVWFSEQAVSIAVLEVGMGGRLDATNVVDPLLSVITDISLDHMEWLGGSIAEIAREKAGILRRGKAMITLPQHPEANQAIGEVAESVQARGVSATGFMPPFNLDPGKAYSVEFFGGEVQVEPVLSGSHQHRNLALAICAASELAEHHGFPITPQSISEGIRSTSWPGRLEIFQIGRQQWILDVAHNPAGAWALKAGWKQIAKSTDRAGILFSCLKDKAVSEMAQILLPDFSRAAICPINSPRAATLFRLSIAVQQTEVPMSVYDAPDTAVRELIHSPELETVVVAGSVYLVGEVRRILKQWKGEER